MATLVQPAPFSDTHTYHQPRAPRQQQQKQPDPSYTAAIPLFQQATGPQAQIYKQINVIPGLDAENALVDTGVKLIRPSGSQVQVAATTNEYDGKRMRRSMQRRTVDYNASMLQMVKHRLYKRSILQKPTIQPDPLYYTEIVQPRSILYNPIYSVTSRFVRASTNKIRCPVFCVAWTPEGRRVVTGTNSGEFTLWNGLTFNFETILQAHESAVRAMEWSHNDQWLLSGDHNGVIKYWQSNMNNVKMIQAHTDPVRGLSFCPTDNKFVTCSDDGLLKVWDFYRCVEEGNLRGHGADVKCVGWHPSKGMIASGSKDSQQPLKLWDPKSGVSLATIHGHKSTVMDLDWNKNGNWLLTGSRDRLVKVFDIRVMKEIFTFRGHKKEAASVNWHPLYEEMFASGGSDGSLMFWLLGCEKELGAMENAHDGMIWDIQWHPLGHILCSGSNDHTTKFWTRNRPGDKMRDKYNLNILPSGYDDDYEYELPTTGSHSTEDSMLDESMLSASYLTNSGTPLKPDNFTGKLEKEEMDSPLVKALLEQSALEVIKGPIADTPAQVFTVATSQLRATAPEFKIDTSTQQTALAEGDKLEKNREKILRKGDDKGSKRRRTSIHDEFFAINAPSLLDLDIAPPSFLKDHDWDDDTKEAPFIDEAREKAQANLLDQNPDSNMNNDNFINRPSGFSSGPPPPNQFHGSNGPPRFDGPPNMNNMNVPRFDGPPNMNNMNGPPRFDGPPNMNNLNGPPRFDGPPSRFDGPPNMNNMNGQRFEGPHGLRFDGPNGPRFDGPNGPRFDGPNGPRFDGPNGPRFDGPNGQKFDGPSGPRFDGPPGPRFDGPPNNFNRPPPNQGNRFNGPYPNNEPSRPNFNYNNMNDRPPNEYFDNNSNNNPSQRFSGPMNGPMNGHSAPPPPQTHHNQQSDYDDRYNNEFRQPEKRWDEERLKERWAESRQRDDFRR